jgi:hypothetical protein
LLQIFALLLPIFAILLQIFALLFGIKCTETNQSQSSNISMYIITSVKLFAYSQSFIFEMHASSAPIADFLITNNNRMPDDRHKIPIRKQIFCLIAI